MSLDCEQKRRGVSLVLRGGRFNAVGVQHRGVVVPVDIFNHGVLNREGITPLTLRLKRGFPNLPYG